MATTIHDFDDDPVPGCLCYCRFSLNFGSSTTVTCLNDVATPAAAPQRLPELTDTHFIYRTSRGTSNSVLIKDILKVERNASASRPHDLMVTIATRNISRTKQISLSFKNDSELYKWYDKLNLIVNQDISMPWNFKHVIHTAHDPISGQFVGMPPAFQEQLPEYSVKEKETDWITVQMKVDRSGQVEEKSV
ncbi:CRIB domain-containing protein [Mycena chlorophos]|uniref:CRIB domain-containing protein n=1 Tax=Mycena chlorophos TaxID=658473 RepID=A0A8H6VQT3_MYCCL|nr:CRIB domain-containing protein [Mycena chlorophos]